MQTEGTLRVTNLQIVGDLSSGTTCRHQLYDWYLAVTGYRYLVTSFKKRMHVDQKYMQTNMACAK